MQEVLNENIISLNRPIVLMQKGRKTEVNLTGRNTGHTLSIISNLLIEEMKGIRVHSSERTTVLKADEADLMGARDGSQIRSTHSSDDRDADHLNTDEESAIDRLLCSAAERRNLPVELIRRALSDYLDTPCVKTIPTSQHIKVIRFLLSLPGSFSVSA